MSEKKRRVNIATTLDQETFGLFDRVAWARRHRRNADALREAIDDYLEKHGSLLDDEVAETER